MQPQIVNDKWTGSGRLKKRNHNGNDEKDLVQFVREDEFPSYYFHMILTEIEIKNREREREREREG